MKKAEIRALEKVFAAEIDGKHLLQSKAQIYDQLAEQGMVESVSLNLGGRFPVHVAGWVLTHRGRMAYCETCRDSGEAGNG